MNARLHYLYLLHSSYTKCFSLQPSQKTIGTGLCEWVLYRRYRDTGEDVDTLAAQMGVDPYELTNREASMSPIGANKLLYAPYLMGERSPHNNPDARAAFIGMSMDSSRADMTQAVLEGVAF